MMLLVQNLNAQTSYRLHVGAGVPEMINVGARINIYQTHLGFKLGSFLDFNESYAFQINAAYHFAGNSSYSNQDLYYIQPSFEQSFEKLDKLSTKRGSIASLRFGRDFYLTKNFCIDINLGLGYLVELKCSGPTWCIAPDIWPSCSMAVGVNF